MQALRTTSKMASRLGSPSARKIFARSSVPVLSRPLPPGVYFDSRESISLYMRAFRGCGDQGALLRPARRQRERDDRPAAPATIVGTFQRNPSMPDPQTAAPGRLPAVYLGHGAPTLIDDATWPAELAAWAAGLPAAQVDPGRQRALAVGAAHARRHRPGAARLRLLRLPRALLPDPLRLPRRARPGGSGQGVDAAWRARRPAA